MLAEVFALFLANLLSQGGGASSALLTGGAQHWLPARLICWYSGALSGPREGYC